MNLLRRWRSSKFRADERGNEMIEFALSSTVLLMVIFGIMDMSRALYSDHYVSSVSRDATRYAMVRGSTWKNAPCSTPQTFSCTATALNVTSFVKSVTPDGFTASNLTVTTTWPGKTAAGASCTTNGNNAVNAQGCVVTVKVAYAFNFVLPFLPRGALTLTSTASSVIVQ